MAWREDLRGTMIATQEPAGMTPEMLFRSVTDCSRDRLLLWNIERFVYTVYFTSSNTTSVGILCSAGLAGEPAEGRPNSVPAPLALLERRRVFAATKAKQSFEEKANHANRFGAGAFPYRLIVALMSVPQPSRILVVICMLSSFFHALS